MPESLEFVGVDPGVAILLPAIALVTGFVAIWLLRDRPGPAYSVAVITMLLGSPVVNVNWFTVLLAALAPVVWPMPDGNDRRVVAGGAAGPTATADKDGSGAPVGA